MAIETRGKRRYYYRKRKVGGRVYSEYVAAGSLATMLAGLDAYKRQAAQDEREEARRIIDQERAIDRQIAALISQSDEFVTALMLASGYHQHKRQWRKKRDCTS